MYYITSASGDEALHPEILKLSEHAEEGASNKPMQEWLLHYGIIDPGAPLQQTRADFQMLRDVRRGVQQAMRVFWATIFKAIAIALAALIGLGLHGYIQQLMSVS